VIPKIQDHTIKKRTMILSAFVFILLASLYGFSQNASAKSLGAFLASNNLLELISRLGGTTDQMLTNTNRLHQQVQEVQGKLSQLNEQVAILQKQAQTSQNLSQQLSIQETLTKQGITWMGNILEKEQQSVQLTDQLAEKSQQLANGVNKNAGQMNQLVPLLKQSLDQSSRLNSQLDELLNELEKSQSTFKLFGNLNQLLLHPTDLQGTITKIDEAPLPSTVKDVLKSLLP
jgi:chromosome segregation ATPase